MKIRYYKDADIKDNQEISFEQVQKLTTYIKAYFTDNECLDRTEFYNDSVLLTVDYYNTDNQLYEDIKAFHFQNYQGVRFTTRKDLLKIKGYTWRIFYSFSPLGDMTKISQILYDENEKALMQINLNTNHQVFEILKFYEEKSELRYIFNYDKNGNNYAGLDFLYEDDISVSEVRDSLAEPEFYDNGYNLPQELANTTIPSIPQIS